MSTRKIFSAIMMAFVVALLTLPTYSASAAEQLVKAYEEKQSTIICSFNVPDDRVSNY